MGTIYTAKTTRSYSEKVCWDTHLALCTSEGYVKDLGGKIKLFENEIIFVALSPAYWRVGWDGNREKEVLLKGNGHPCWKRPQRWVKSFHCIWQSEEIIQTQTKTSKLCLVHYFKIRGYLKRKKKDSIFDHGILLRDFSPKVLLHIKTKQNLRTNFYNPGSSFHF